VSGAWRLQLTLACCVLALLGPALAADVPFLTGRIVDNAEILKPATRDKITAILKAHEQESGDQIAILTLPTLGGESVEEYAVRVFENWKLGQKGKDNGVVVIVVPQDHVMRIEVGYGLEGVLTDVAASRIIRNVMTPQFKAGDFDRGVSDGVTAIIAVLEGRPVGAADGPDTASASSGGALHINQPNLAWPERILFGAFIFGIIGLFTFIGIVTPGMGWFLYVFLIPFWAMFPIIIVGTRGALTLLAIYVVGYPIAKLLLARSPWYQKAAQDLKSKGTASVGGFTFSSGGGSSGFSSGGGGFSGGGGSSGSW